MDPNKTFEDFVNAISDGDLLSARDQIQNLKIWVDQGGFLPAFPPSSWRVGSDFITQMARIVDTAYNEEELMKVLLEQNNV